LSRQGRYQEVAGSLRVKEVRIAEDERFVICHSPEGAERDATIRARMITQLKELIDGTDALSKDKRAELRGVISTKPGLNRYLRVTRERHRGHLARAAPPARPDRRRHLHRPRRDLPPAH
jgi:hypothetical protein